MIEQIEQLATSGFEKIEKFTSPIEENLIFEHAISKGKTIWLSDKEEQNKYFYANYILLKELLIPKLVNLKRQGDTTAEIVEEHISMVRLFFNAWYEVNGLQYENPLYLATTLSPRSYFELSDMLSYAGKTFNVYPMYNIVMSAMALRHGIEAALFESAGCPLNEAEKTPGLNSIISTLKRNHIPVTINIPNKLLKFFNLVDNGTILNDCYDFLSKPYNDIEIATN